MNSQMIQADSRPQVPVHRPLRTSLLLVAFGVAAFVAGLVGHVLGRLA